MKGVNPEYLKRHGIEVPRSKPSKYGARKTEYNGVTYASGLEAACAAQLDRLQAAGLVVEWKGQPRYELAAGLRYTADFEVRYATGLPRVIDAKGVLTRDFVMRRKLFEDRYGPLDVVTRWQDMPTGGR